MIEKTYNGWTNYETWNAALWIGNEQGSQEYWSEAAQECYNEAEAKHGWTRKQNATTALARKLKDDFEEAEADILDRADIQASMWADLLGAALSEVNWHEIAEHLVEEVDEDAIVATDD